MRSRSFFYRISFLLCAAVAPTLLHADPELDRQQRALDIISSFADKLCKEVPLVGEAGSVELSVNAQAELTGIIKKIGRWCINPLIN